MSRVAQLRLARAVRIIAAGDRTIVSRETEKVRTGRIESAQIENDAATIVSVVVVVVVESLALSADWTAAV